MLATPRVRSSDLIVLRAIAHLLVLFVAAAGFLFGQLYSGHFSPGATLAGTGGIVAALVGWASWNASAGRVALAAAVAGIAGAALHVFEYYSTPRMPGNYYAWFLTLPFVAGLLVLAWPSLQHLRSPANGPGA